MPVPTLFGAIGAGGFDAAALALFARMTTPPSDARKQLINNCIVTLKSGGVWSRMTALYVTAAADTQAANLNWIGATNTLVPMNAPTFTTDRGYRGTAATGAGTPYLATGIAANTLSQNDVSLSVWYQDMGAGVDDGGDGARDSGANGWLLQIPRSTANQVSAWAFTTASNMVASNSTAGLITTTRTASNAEAVYKNGSSVTSDALGSATPTTRTLTFLAYNFGATFGGHANREAAIAIGQGLSAAQASALYTALQNYMTGVGA